MMNVIEIEDVTKRFDEFYAVRNLSFDVKQGSIFGLLGPNGAGKTTTIRMIVNIFGPDSGSIRLLGQAPSPALQQRIGYLPEERGLYKKMKIGDQLLFFAALKGLSSDQAAGRIDAWLQRLDLSDWKQKKAVELSKGMQQKVQFIGTILHEPDLLILDEPFSGLDPVSVSQMKKAILEFREEGRTVIFSTHQMEQVEQMCDDICLINKATKVLGGNLREIKRRYGQNTVLLDFEGSDSFLSDGLVKRLNRYANYVEILLPEGVEAQALLKAAIDSGAKVNRFELVEPSLNEIFIESVTGKNGKDSGNNQA
jgi:ABC-2 type transport system ATP-binding protein